jgi:hypothetical protein
MKGINTSVYSVTGQTAQAYKTPKINIDFGKKSRLQEYQDIKERQSAKAFRENVDNFVLTKINDLPEDYTAEKLPPAIQNAIQPRIIEARQLYANSARLLANMKSQSGSPEFLRVMDQMNNSKRTIESLNNNLVELQELTNEYVDNRDMMSKGMNAEKVAALDEIFVNKNYTMQFMPDGSPLYQTQYGALRQEDISKYFLKDSTFSLDVLKQAQSMYSKGSKGLDLSKDQSAFQLLKAQFSNALDKGGSETIKSLMSDDLFDGFKLIDIPDEIANDPERRDEVQDMILDSIMGHISTVNADGLKQYKAAQVAKAGKSGRSGVRGYKMGQGLQDDLASFDYQAADSKERINKVVEGMGGLLGETRISEENRQVLFAQKVPEYRQEVATLIKERMSPSDRGKLMTREEMFDLFKSDEDVIAREFNPDQLREAFINTYGNAGFYYDNNPFDINIADAYSISNALFDLADISQDAKNTYKSELALEQRSGRLAAQRQQPTADDLIAKYSN